MKASQKIIMGDVIGSFREGITIETKPNIIPTTNRLTKPIGTIGKMVETLREEYGLTYEVITQTLSDMLQRPIPMTTMQNWLRGSTPRGGGDDVEKALNEIIRSSEHIEGGVWCSDTEVKETIERINMSLTIVEMSRISGTPATTLMAWISGACRAPRKRFNHFVASIKEYTDKHNSD